MVYLALNQQHLSRLHYHPLWGLQVDQRGTPSLYDDVETLHHDPIERDRKIAQVHAIVQQTGLWGWLLRGFCWITNWNQYRTDYYKLQAYFSWCIYEQGIPMLTPVQQTNPNQQGGFFIARSPINTAAIHLFLSTSRQQLSSMVSSVIAPMSWVGERALSLLFPNQPLETASFTTTTLNKTHFIVNDNMIPLLEILGIEAIQDQAIAHEDLNKAYRASCLITHPDKSKNDATAFLNVKHAYDTLVEQINTASDPLGIQEKLQRMDDDIATLRYQNQKNQALKKEFDEAANRYLVRVDRAGKQIDEQGKRIDEQGKQLDEISKQVDTLCEDRRELKNRLLALLAAAPQPQNPNRLFTPPTHPPTPPEMASNHLDTP